MALEIRIAGPGDLEDAARLFEASIRAHAAANQLEVRSGFDWVEETRLRMERNGSEFFLAYVDGNAVGIQAAHFATGRKKNLIERVMRRFETVPTSPFPHTSAGMLTDVFVSREFRRSGVGRALVTAAQEWLESKGVDRTRMDVRLDNEAMLTVARLAGFSVTTQRLETKSRREARP